MTENQIQFLLDNFFSHNQLCDFSGWKKIATKLIKDGKCIVPGDGHLWGTGVGNYIQREYAPGAVGCSLLKFDVKAFAAPDNAFFVNALEQEIENTQAYLETVERRLKELKEFQ